VTIFRTKIRTLAKPLKTIGALAIFWVSLVKLKPNSDTPLPKLAQTVCGFGDGHFFRLRVGDGHFFRLRFGGD
jgi:hypothetical protein